MAERVSNDEFWAWVEAEIARRQLNLSHVERLARFSSGAISKLARQRSAPILTVYLGLARVFWMQSEDAVCHVGNLDPISEPLEEKALDLLHALLPRRRILIARLLQALLEEKDTRPIEKPRLTALIAVWRDL
jgi:hypothetical protein